MKKQKITLFIGFIILVNIIFSTNAIAEDNEKTKVNTTESDNTYHLVVTSGPAWMRIFMKIEFIDGNPLKITELNRYFTRSVLSEKIQPVFATGLTFKITYRLPVAIFSRFSFFTFNTTEVNIDKISDPDYIQYLVKVIKDINNYSSFTRNRRHIVTFKNFTGVFQLQQGKLFRWVPPKFFIPAKFVTVGFCDKIIWR
ncbi:MAG: hypothetical protein JSV67_00545 [Thermoplasmatales archaeon]|nr:MAG: hypothetical protein JSV67_00545 [Thermoplasmatales archaeon]